MPDKKSIKSQRKKERQEKRRRLQRWVLPLVLLTLGVTVLGVYLLFDFLGGAENRRRSDLSSIGKGVPAVVQIHDRTCPICTNLRQNIEALEKEFPDSKLLIRVADIAQPEARAFAQQFTVNTRVTLLFFDAQGELVDIQVGLQETQELRKIFELHSQGRSLHSLD